MQSNPDSPLIYLTRIEQFSSAHRLFNKSWDDSTNKRTFGKCDNVHGHNYKLEVTVKGRLDPSTGMLMNIAKLKTIIEHYVLALLDHRNIDQDVDYFRENNFPSTSENISVFIWNQIANKLPANVQMHRIKLHETEKNVVEYFG